MKPSDALIVGGGPAGAASALFLSRKGFTVRLLEQARFPRDKVCGEFISPAADPILEELGVLTEIDRLAPVRLKGVAISSYETAGFAVDYPAMPGRQEAMTSLSLPRSVLDPLLLGKSEGRRGGGVGGMQGDGFYPAGRAGHGRDRPG